MGEASQGCRNAGFRLGTTSFIYRADWLTNAVRLAKRVADVELLFFDSAPGAFPASEELLALRDLESLTGLTYSIHAPLDLALASADETSRRRSVERVRPCVEAAQLLSAEALVLHVYLGEREGDQPPVDLDGWRARARRSLEEIQQMGMEPSSLCVELLDYDFSLIEPVLDQLKISAALDLGHARRDGRPVLELLRRNLHRARVIHWHGVDGEGHDHHSLRHWPREEALALLRTITQGNYRGVLTLEVFGEHELDESLEVLDELWEELHGKP